MLIIYLYCRFTVGLTPKKWARPSLLLWRFLFPSFLFLHDILINEPLSRTLRIFRPSLLSIFAVDLNDIGGSIFVVRSSSYETPRKARSFSSQELGVDSVLYDNILHFVLCMDKKYGCVSHTFRMSFYPIVAYRHFFSFVLHFFVRLGQSYSTFRGAPSLFSLVFVFLAFIFNSLFIIIKTKFLLLSPLLLPTVWFSWLLIVSHSSTAEWVSRRKWVPSLQHAKRKKWQWAQRKQQ